MNRRIFLRGLGGAIVAAPFLGSLAGRRAKAEAAKPPQRLILMFTHYGCLTSRFFPVKSHGPLSAADLTPTTLKPLAPFASKLLIPRGIRAMNEWTATLSRGQGNDSHSQVVQSYFTCQPVTPNNDDAFRFSDTYFTNKPIGPSLDHVICQALNPAILPLHINVGSVSSDPDATVSWSAAQTIFPGLRLNQAFSNLTGLFKAGAPLDPDSYQAARGKSIVDLVRTDLNTLERIDMSQSDKRKLDAWKDLLDQTSTAIVAAQCGQAEADLLSASQANVDAASKGGLGKDNLTTQLTSTLDMADLHANIAVLAALCNVSPVILLKYPQNYVFTGLGLDHEAHSLSHRTGDANMAGTCLAGALDSIATIDDYYAKKFAHLVAQLDGTAEGDGTLLDNTATVWFQEMSDGAAHNLNNLPIIQAGGSGGYFKTGWTVNVEDGSPNLTAGNSESACANGPPDTINGTTQSTGTDPNVSNAPINKYYCNLMNALGVKAGADGFAALGGTAEVTCFGRYDKTQDFIHGDVNAPKIWDPGEFTALKANS